MESGRIFEQLLRIFKAILCIVTRGFKEKKKAIQCGQNMETKARHQ